MKRLIHALIIGLMGSIAVFYSTLLHFNAWIIFVTWVCYYVFGKSSSQILSVSIQIIGGTWLAIAISMMAVSLKPYLADYSLPMSVLCVVSIFIFFLKNMKPYSSVPLFFIGMIVFFSEQRQLNMKNYIYTLVELISGFAFAALTEKLCTWNAYNPEKN